MNLPIEEISDQILQCVQAASNHVTLKVQERDAMSKPVADRFVEIFKNNLESFIREAYPLMHEMNCEELADDDPKKEELEYEKAVRDLIMKRQQGTKACKDVTEKTLDIEKRLTVSMEVTPGSVTNEKFTTSDEAFRKDELKVSAKKTVEYLQGTAKQAIELDGRVDELLRAATIFKDVRDVELELATSQ